MISRLRTAGLAACLVTVGVVGVLQGTPAHGDTPRTPGSIVREDTFSRRNDASRIGRSWHSVNGTWGIERGKAFLSGRATGDNVAVLDGAVRGGTASVTLSGQFNGGGLVFRYRDASNYWALVADAPDAVWKIVKVIDGRTVVVGHFGEVSLVEPARVSVELRGADLYVWAEELLHTSAPRHLRDDALSAASGVGLFVGSESSGDARFENFTVAR